VSIVSQRRGITYSAEAKGDRGTLRCHVVARQLLRDGSVQYAVSVSNGTNANAQALAFVPEKADQHYRTIVQTIIGPSSDFSTTVVLKHAPPGSVPEIHLALTSAEIEFTLAIPSPPNLEIAGPPLPPGAPVAARGHASATPVRSLLPVVFDSYVAPDRPIPAKNRTEFTHARTGRETRSPTSPAVTLILLSAMAVAGVLAFLVARPQIVEFSLPKEAGARSSVTVAYRATGIGTAEYTVLAQDGQTVAVGPVERGTGTFLLTLPQSSAAQTYRVRLRVSNLLGAATAEDNVRVAAPAAPAPAPPRRITAPVPAPQIRSLALDRATVASGDPLNVYYDVIATSGTIALLDPASQITYGKAQLDASGHTSFVAPRTDTTRFLTVVVTANRGAATVQSRIGVSLTPLNADSPQPNAATGADTPAGSDVAPTEISAPQQVRSGTSIRVDVRGATAGLQIALLDGNGSEVARREISAGQSSVRFTAPRVTRTTQFRFEATYPHGAGSETIVRMIAVTP
jgi:hypothetical protein